MLNMIHIYSSEQFDGIATSAIIARYATLKKLKYKIDFIDYSCDPELKEDEHIFFADINPERINLEKIKKQIFFWAAYYPHKNEEKINIKVKHNHVMQPTAYEEYTKKSAAEAATRKFLPNDRIANEIARISRDIKFWEQKDERAEKLNALLSSGQDKKQIVETLARGSLWNETFENKIKEYAIKRDEALDEMMKTIRIKKYLKINFGIFLASNVLSSAESGHHALQKHKGIDVALVIFRNGRMSFRRRENCEEDLSKIAKLFRGGGHPYAAGGKIDGNPTQKNFEQIIFQINQTLQKHFIS